MKNKLTRHITITIILLLTIAIRSFGQQDPLFTQYMSNPVLINPAYAGTFTNININGIYREQWTGIEWHPKTTSLSVTSPFLNYKVGVGLTLLDDEIGPLTQTGLYADYAYHIDFDNDAQLSFGLKVGFNHYEKDLQDLSTTEYDSWVSLNPKTSKFLFNAGIGVYYSTKKYFIGASIPKLIRNNLSDEDENTYEIVGKEERHYFLTGGALFGLNTIFKLKPTIMLRAVNGSPYSIDLSATLITYDRFWFGLMYRVGDAIGAQVRIEVQDGFQIGFSYDYTNSRLKEYNNGTYELSFSYSIRQRGRRILSPRYF